MEIIDCVSTEIWLPGMNKDVVHAFIVVKDLIAPAIVGVDVFPAAQINCGFFNRKCTDLLITSQYHVSIFGKKHRPPVDYVTATLDASDVIIDCAIPLWS